MNRQQYHIKVEVQATYVREQSEPENNRFVFAYTITITNTGQVPAQLLSRHWVITDANNKVQEVRGEGVVGERYGSVFAFFEEREVDDPQEGQLVMTRGTAQVVA